MVDDTRQAGEIALTPAMIEAGVYAAREFCLGEGLAELVRNVFVAMKTEELDAKCPSFFNQSSGEINEQPSDR